MRQSMSSQHGFVRPLLSMLIAFSISCSAAPQEESLLKVQFAQSMEITKKAGSNVVLLLDASGSIGSDVWSKRVIPVAKQLVESCKGTVVSVVKYSSKASIVQTPTKDLDEAIKRIKDMSYDAEATDTATGFELAFATLPKTDEKPRVVIHITDGQPNNLRAAREKALDMIVEGVRIFGIGVGSGLSLANLQEMSSSGLAMHVKDYDQLLRIVSQEMGTKSSFGTSDGTVDLQVGLPPDAAVGLKDVFTLNIHIHNNGVEQPIPAGTLMTVSDPQHPPFFMPKTVQLKEDILGGSHNTVSVTLKPRGASTSIADVPTMLHVSIISPSGEPVVPLGHTVGMPLDAYSKHFEGVPLNFLMIGFPGVGKTTFFKSSATALSRLVQEVSNIGGGDGHVTKKITLYRLRDWGTRANVLINLWDTWGITKESFTLELVEKLCFGRVPDGYHMQEYARSRAYLATNETLITMDAVLFFIRATQSKDDELLQRMKQYVHRLTDLGYSSLIIVSWLNEVSVEDHDGIIAAIADALQLPTSRVMAWDGYVNETEKEPSKDRNVLQILERAVRHGSLHQKRRRIEGQVVLDGPQESLEVGGWTLYLKYVITVLCFLGGLCLLVCKCSRPAQIPAAANFAEPTAKSAREGALADEMYLGASAGVSQPPSVANSEVGASGAASRLPTVAVAQGRVATGKTIAEHSSPSSSSSSLNTADYLKVRELHEDSSM